MAKKINHREHREALLFFSVPSVVFRIIPEINKKFRQNNWKMGLCLSRAIRANTYALTAIEISMCVQGSGGGQCRATRVW